MYEHFPPELVGKIYLSRFNRDSGENISAVIDELNQADNSDPTWKEKLYSKPLQYESMTREQIISAGLLVGIPYMHVRDVQDILDIVGIYCLWCFVRDLPDLEEGPYKVISDPERSIDLFPEVFIEALDLPDTEDDDVKEYLNHQEMASLYLSDHKRTPHSELFLDLIMYRQLRVYSIETNPHYALIAGLYPNWKSAKKHPLEDVLLLDGEYLERNLELLGIPDIPDEPTSSE